jgi:hypothetical protein
MNIFLWILQIVLALHTAMGAVWKFSNVEPTLRAIPLPIWRSMSVLELLIAMCLLLPTLLKYRTELVPIAAACIALEMLLMCVINVFSGNTNFGHLVYWLVVAAVASFLAYGRFVLSPF